MIELNPGLFRILNPKLIDVSQFMLKQLLYHLDFFQSNIRIQKLIPIHLSGNDLLHKMIYNR